MSIINNVNRIVDIIVVLSMSLGEKHLKELYLIKLKNDTMLLLVKRHIRSMLIMGRKVDHFLN